MDSVVSAEASDFIRSPPTASNTSSAPTPGPPATCCAASSLKPATLKYLAWHPRYASREFRTTACSPSTVDGNSARKPNALLRRLNQVRRLLGKHDGRRIGVAADQRQHDEGGHRRAPLRANAQTTEVAADLFDYLVGVDEQRLRHVDPLRVGRLDEPNSG